MLDKTKRLDNLKEMAKKYQKAAEDATDPKKKEMMEIAAKRSWDAYYKAGGGR